MGALKVGRGTEPDVDVGPLIDEAQRGKGHPSSLATAVTARRARGAARPVVRCRGPSTPATSSSPPFLADVPDGARCSARRSSDPSAPIATFASEEQALEAANRTEYGLVATSTPATWVEHSAV